MSEHQCHAVGCGVPVPPKMHMCLKHWRMVPRAVQDLIWRHYRPGQEIDKRPSVEYIMTAFVSISCVALKESRALPRLTNPAEDLARCDREIAHIKEEARAGNPDVEGILLGLHDWRTEKELIEAERK